MKEVKYKPGKEILSYSNKNNYCQYYDWYGMLWYKGYRKNNKHIGYEEYYLGRMNKAIKYII